MSDGQDLIPAGRRELPEINVPAVPRASAPAGRRPMASVLSLLGVLGLSMAVVAPTGVALAEAPAETAVVDNQFAQALGDAQSIIVDSAVSSFTPVARGEYEIYVKPKPTPTPTPTTASAGQAPAVSQTLPLYTGGGAPAEWMAQAGIAESDRAYVDYIVRRESGWNPNATNRSSGACGLVQALPCSKVPGNGYNPVDNLRWADGYAKGRYGSWEQAYNFWTRNHWW